MKLSLEQQHIVCPSQDSTNILPADALAILGASASTGMILTVDTQSQNILSAASEESR